MKHSPCCTGALMRQMAELNRQKKTKESTLDYLIRCRQEVYDDAVSGNEVAMGIINTFSMYATNICDTETLQRLETLVAEYRKSRQ